jgi:hypothetical protein
LETHKKEWDKEIKELTEKLKDTEQIKWMPGTLITLDTDKIQNLKKAML